MHFISGFLTGLFSGVVIGVLGMALASISKSR